MTIPLELTFRTDDVPAGLRDRIEHRVARLDHLHTKATHCRVVIDKPHQHATSGSPYEVVVTLSVPSTRELVAHEQPGKHPMHESLERIVGRAFEALESQVKETVARQRSQTKRHEAEDSIAVVRELPQEEGAMGWLQPAQGGEVPFGRRAVVGGHWERLTIGSVVHYEIAADEQGLRATTVRLIDKPGVRHQRAGADAS